MGFESPRTHIPMDSLIILIYEICYCKFKIVFVNFRSLPIKFSVSFYRVNEKRDFIL